MLAMPFGVCKIGSVVRLEEMAMKIRKKTTKTYHCGVCKTGYPTPQEAENCEKYPVEQRVANIGDYVRISEKRECLMADPKIDPYYVAEGVITGFSPPLPFDMEYELKWLGGKRERLNSHVHLYYVRYTCPRCNEEREQSVFALEFTILKSKEKTASE
ncbi:MAG: hypothetical protein UY04_C0004G0017 [Parcubacteria group bacterium GW2011_GWA2_47_7]|nr:MAG: hypothetical protein UY04_C0004G0017 [Parcubacteria group bacterium GW2011_GWA2_47_7]